MGNTSMIERKLKQQVSQMTLGLNLFCRVREETAPAIKAFARRVRKQGQEWGGKRGNYTSNHVWAVNVS